MSNIEDTKPLKNMMPGATFSFICDFCEEKVNIKNFLLTQKEWDLIFTAGTEEKDILKACESESCQSLKVMSL
jgi:hypothetical protein